MALTFDEVGNILQNATADYPDDLIAARVEARRVVGERALAEMGTADLDAELVTMLQTANEVLSGLSVLAQFEKQRVQLRLTDLASGVIRTLNMFWQLCLYLEDHWDTLPESISRLGWNAKDIKYIGDTFGESMVQYVDAFEQTGSFDFGSFWIEPMLNTTKAFYFFVLGDYRAGRLAASLNASLAHLRQHFAILDAAEDAAQDTAKKTKES